MCDIRGFNKCTILVLMPTLYSHIVAVSFFRLSLTLGNMLLCFVEFVKTRLRSVTEVHDSQFGRKNWNWISNFKLIKMYVCKRLTSEVTVTLQIAKSTLNKNKNLITGIWIHAKRNWYNCQFKDSHNRPKYYLSGFWTMNFKSGRKRMKWGKNTCQIKWQNMYQMYTAPLGLSYWHIVHALSKLYQNNWKWYHGNAY